MYEEKDLVFKFHVFAALSSLASWRVESKLLYSQSPTYIAVRQVQKCRKSSEYSFVVVPLFRHCSLDICNIPLHIFVVPSFRHCWLDIYNISPHFYMLPPHRITIFSRLLLLHKEI
jgi:hypothetical protein